MVSLLRAISPLFLFGERAIQVVPCVGLPEIRRERIKTISTAADAKHHKTGKKQKRSAKPLIRHQIAELPGVF